MWFGDIKRIRRVKQIYKSTVNGLRERVTVKCVVLYGVDEISRMRSEKFKEQKPRYERVYGCGGSKDGLQG